MEVVRRGILKLGAPKDLRCKGLEGLGGKFKAEENEEKEGSTYAKLGCYRETNSSWKLFGLLVLKAQRLPIGLGRSVKT